MGRWRACISPHFAADSDESSHSAVAPIADIHRWRHHGRMSWIVELILQGIWEGIAKAAYREAGWLGVVAALIVPLAIFIFLVWAAFR